MKVHYPLGSQGFGGKGQSSMNLGVGRELVRNAVASSTERAYPGYFGFVGGVSFERDTLTGVFRIY